MIKYSKKFFSALLVICLLSYVASPLSAKAATTTTIEMLPNGIYMETTIEPTPEDNGISLCSLSRTSTKTVKFKNGFGTVLATYKLKGTFTYGTGAPAVCTAASCTTSTKSSAVKFTAKSAYKSGNKAIGSYTLTSAASTTKKTLTITCSPSGAIS